jgi:nogalonic acid methyl ester cyclase / aklanonic acid methyl ester cyclase
VQQSDTQLVLRLIDGVFNRGDLALVDELVHRDFFDHDAPPTRAVGPGGLRATVRALRDAFAGFRLDPADVISADGKVVVRASATGRHTGSIDGIEPTGEEWLAQQFHVFRIVDGRVIEHWASRDACSARREGQKP